MLLARISYLGEVSLLQQSFDVYNRTILIFEISILHKKLKIFVLELHKSTKY